MIAVFLQVRLDSTRLPGKALLPILGKPMVRVVMDALRNISADLYVLVTDREGKEHLESMAEEAGFQTFEGPKLDVLGRFCQAIEKYRPTTVVRATGDNPLVSWELANRILYEHLELKADYSAYQGMPIGFGVEVVQAEALLKAQGASEDPYDHEHVTPFLYRHPELFYLHQPLVSPRFRGRARVTVDTREDYEHILSLFRRIPGNIPPALEVLMRLLGEQKEEV